jgi:hypothetical protein
MPQKSEILTKRFRLAPISPDKVGEDWVRWSRDPVLMSQLNARVVQLTRADIQRYVAASWKNKRMVIGIYALFDGAHIGIYEAAIDARHGNVRIDMLVDPQRYALPNVLPETDPALLDFFATEHRIEKAIVQAVETNTPVIRHLEATGWRREGVLRKEYVAASGNRRLDAVQFGRLIGTAADEGQA